MPVNCWHAAYEAVLLAVLHVRAWDMPVCTGYLCNDVVFVYCLQATAGNSSARGEWGNSA